MNKTQLFKSYISKRKLPLNYNESDKFNFEVEFEKIIEPSFIYHFSNAYITYEGIVIYNYKIVQESLYHQSAKSKYGLKYILKSLIKNKITKIDKNVAVIFNEWGTGYGHWMTESLPRLISINNIENLYIILPENVLPSIIDSLKPFNIKNIIYINKHTTIKAEKIIMPTLIAQTGNYNEESIQSLRSIFRNYYSNKINNSNQRIYLSRNKAKKRKITNENELINLLIQFDFNIVYVEDLSFEQQVEIFINTQYLVSIHGATLANMIFMNHNTNIIEIRNKLDKRSLCYYSLASAIDINYYYIFAHPNNPRLKNNSDLTIEIPNFKAMLDKIFKA
ncbi:MAG: hypothetical protein A2X12_04220 [Bacteroidetes bacterium GWE2_29_8]|nr:MAG: hypothetical protein A2X12_04220 [Bacteroidetes bacterium GWE2_29_8]OFY24985.1 MAG: hypothetical protein A2X02_08060 [Bacteroidetes bacterium GWF2_29_10]